MKQVTLTGRVRSLTHTHTYTHTATKRRAKDHEIISSQAKAIRVARDQNRDLGKLLTSQEEQSKKVKADLSYYQKQAARLEADLNAVVSGAEAEALKPLKAEMKTLQQSIRRLGQNEAELLAHRRDREDRMEATLAQIRLEAENLSNAVRLKGQVRSSIILSHLFEGRLAYHFTI